MTHEIIEGSPDQVQDLKVEYVPIGSLKPLPRNARTHSKKQIRQIADSTREFGFTNPNLVDGQVSTPDYRCINWPEQKCITCDRD